MKHKQKNIESGFTLIELLVVVAIIGILASVVLASLGGARGKASDVKIKAQLNNMRNQAELYSGTGTIAFDPAATCATTTDSLFETANSGLGKLFEGIDLEDTFCGSEAGQPSTGKAWAVAARMSSGAWCVDSTGYAGDKDLSGVPYDATVDFSGVLVTTSCL